MRTFLLLFACTVAGATVRTVTCSGDVTSALQAAINSSVDGDVVAISDGTCQQSKSTILIKNKNITLEGAGPDRTTLTTSKTTGMFAYVETKASVRITGFTYRIAAGAAGFPLIALKNDYGSQATSGWRVDHMKLVGASGSGTCILCVNGVTYGLIDHVTFDLSLGYGGVSQMGAMFNVDRTSFTPALNGSYSISLPLDFGSDKAVYIEDCTFTNSGNGRYYATFDSDTGPARVVIRNNSFQGVIYAHWTRNSSIDGLKYEVYNNTATCDEGNTTFLRMESGTGVIWGNTIVGCSSGIVIDERRGEQFETSGTLGTCDGTKSWDGNVEASGWPCLGQVGRGAGTPGHQASAPLYAWNNGSDSGCAIGGACRNTINIGVMHVGGPVQSTVFLKSTPHSNGDVDFVNAGSTPKAGYEPFVYPHPLQRIKSSVAAPTNLSVTLQ